MDTNHVKVEQSMDIRTQKKAVVGMVVFRAAIRPNVSRFDNVKD